MIAGEHRYSYMLALPFGVWNSLCSSADNSKKWQFFSRRKNEILNITRAMKFDETNVAGLRLLTILRIIVR